MNDLMLVLIGAIINGLFLSIAMYIGLTKGTSKTVDIALDKVEKRVDKSPTLQKLIKIAGMTDKLFGDDQAVEQITTFFKEATDLVSSPEAKNFFKNVTEMMKGLSGPKKPTTPPPEPHTKKGK